MASDAESGGPKICRAIVGFADLLNEQRLDEVLDAHCAAAPASFRGVRQSVARDSHFPNGIVLRPAEAGMLSDVRFRRGVRTLTRRRLSFDAMLYHEQIPELTALAREIDDAVIVLDHFGCPLGVGPYRGREQDTFRQWQADIQALAKCPNVVVKLGGMGMIITGARFHLREQPPSSTELAREWQPFFETCLAAFGAPRCMFESNFPVDKGMYSYAVFWNACKLLAAGGSPVEKSALFSNTAQRVYRLDTV